MIIATTKEDIKNQQHAIERVIIVALRLETDESTRIIHMQMLGLAPSHAAATALVERLTLADSSELVVVQSELGKMGDIAFETLIRALNQTHQSETQLRYLGALAHCSNPGMITYLDGWYDELRARIDERDKTRGLRIAMSKALKKTGYETLDVLPLLAKLLSDPAPEVRSSAAQVMLDVLRHAYSE